MVVELILDNARRKGGGVDLGCSALLYRAPLYTRSNLPTRCQQAHNCPKCIDSVTIRSVPSSDYSRRAGPLTVKESPGPCPAGTSTVNVPIARSCPSVTWRNPLLSSSSWSVTFYPKRCVFEEFILEKCLYPRAMRQDKQK